MTFYSPLRYPGGKKRLASYFKNLIIKNDLVGGTYVEIYAGGASIALDLLIEGYVSKIIINDKDRSIFALWKSILSYPKGLCKLINETPIDIENRETQKEIQKNKEKYDLKKKRDILELGFSTLYLNRVNRSGIIKAGAIGGTKQKGKWKIDARYNKKDIIARIKLISRYKDKVKLFNLDAIKLIKKIKNKLPKRSLVYLDPPYYIKGKDLYMNYYEHKQHEEIANTIRAITNFKWIITYDDVGPINDFYRGFDNYKYLLNYSAANSGKGREIIIFSKDLNHNSEGLVLA